MMSLSTGAAVLVALLVGVAGALYAYFTRHFGYWRRRGVPYLRPLPIAGNLKDVLLFRKPFETLRKYPVLPFLDRTCTKTYRVPGTDIVLDKGVFAFTSILGIQRDPQYFPEPERFDPERFSDANRRNIPSCCFMPFGEGPHKCVGLRLGYLQGKLGIAHIILNYRIHPCASTPKKMEFNLHSFLISPRDGVPLKFTRVTK
ncbi:Cytochrome P450 6k1 [Gryllus bimaculatus]|nr:Cytochrome P450 6k1 [Gryllus bimaculatus]